VTLSITGPREPHDYRVRRLYPALRGCIRGSDELLEVPVYKLFRLMGEGLIFPMGETSTSAFAVFVLPTSSILKVPRSRPQEQDRENARV